MSIYTIQTDRSIQFGHDGSIEILGLEFKRMPYPTSVTVPEGAVIMVTTASMFEGCSSKMILDGIESSFRTTAKLVRALDGKTHKIIFSVKIDGSINNQRKFLRSIRGKLNGIERSAKDYALQVELDYRLSERMGQLW